MVKNIKHLFNRLSYIVKKYTLKLISSNDSKFIIITDDLISNEILLNGFHERYEINLILDILKKYLPKNSNMIDIGANIGNHSVFFGPHFKKVYCFEPNPILFKILQGNIMLNSLDQKTELINYGLGEKDEYKKYILTTRNLGGSGFFERSFNPKYHHSEYKLKITTGDSIEFKNIGFIKIDTEGYDFNVIKGLRDTIKKFEPIITFEVHPFGKDTSEIIPYLKSLGYEYIYHNHTSRLFPPSLKEIDKFENGRLYNSIICSTYKLK